MIAAVTKRNGNTPSCEAMPDSAVVSDQYEPVSIGTARYWRHLARAAAGLSLKLFVRVEFAFRIRMVVNERMNSRKFLQTFHLPKPKAWPAVIVETAGENFHRDFSTYDRFPALLIACFFHGSAV